MKPAYNLQRIKCAFQHVDDLVMTKSAMQSQYVLGFNDQDVVSVIQDLRDLDFHKSMLPKNDKYQAWQDVYRPQYKGIELYVKFQIDHRGEIVVSFKRK